MNLQRILPIVASVLALCTLPASAVLIAASVVGVNDENAAPLPAGTGAALVIDIDGNGLQPDTSTILSIDNSQTTFMGGDLVVALNSSDEFFGDTFINFPPVDVDLSGPASAGDRYYIVWFSGFNTGSPSTDPGSMDITLADVYCLWATRDDWLVPAASPEPPGGGMGVFTFGQIGGAGHIPEPSALAFLLCGAGAALARRRRA